MENGVKVEIPDYVKVSELKSGCVISFPDVLFKIERKYIRKFEEELVKKSSADLDKVNGLKDHDFLNGTYVYTLIGSDGRRKLFVKFYRDKAVFGTVILY